MSLVFVAAQWKSRESDSLVLIKNWLETPGWSTSWIAAAKMAARISRSVKTAFSWKERQNRGQSIQSESIYCMYKSIY